MNYKLVGANIKRLRKETKLTQRQLGEQIGKTESSIQKYEKGLVEIPNSVIEKIAEVLKVDLDDLIDTMQEINIIEPQTDNLREEIAALRFSLNDDGLAKTKDYMYDLMGNPKYKIGR